MKRWIMDKFEDALFSFGLLGAAEVLYISAHCEDPLEKRKTEKWL